MIVFPIAASGQRLIFTSSVLKHFANHQQRRWWQWDAGGQLFARFALPDIVIVEATGPRCSDWRTRATYHPNRRAEQREIVARHALGLHFIGDWHTHAQPVPVPSDQDMESMRDVVTRSRHALNAFVFVIVGNTSFPDALLVSVMPLFEGYPIRLQPILHG
jgi:integrative and conjugative element protein (TIGR02256 family)